MKQKIIAVNTTGTIIKATPAFNARHRLFEIMAELLDDPSLVSYEKSKNSWQSIYELLEKHTGIEPTSEENKRVLNEFANNILMMNYLSELKNMGRERILIKDFADWLRDKKVQGFRIVMVTSKPLPIAKHTLDIMGCSDIFSDIDNVPEDQDIKSTLDNLKKEGEVVCYIGRTLYDVFAARACNIPFVLATWDFDSASIYAEAEKHATYVASATEDLDDLFPLFDRKIMPIRKVVV